MNQARYDFASDNVAGAMPEALAALVAANEGAVSGYGTDHITARAAELIRELLDADAEVRFVASGTAANALSLACLAQPHEAVLAHAHAHVCTDETGAPGFFGSGVGLIPLAGESGRIEVKGLVEALTLPDVSYRQSPAALSLTNATEYGTVYTEAQVKALIAPVKSKGYGVHLDGARLAGAAAAGFGLKTIAKSGVDILVMGGTKAGSTPSEAIVLFDRKLAHRFDARLKHAGQLVSKGRFLAAPWLGLLGEGVPWLKRAHHANDMARRLAERMPFPVIHPVEANGLFVDMDETALYRLREAGWFVYRFLDGTVRFMCSWATTPEMVDELGEALKKIA